MLTTRACFYAGINISSTNVEVMSGQVISLASFTFCVLNVELKFLSCSG